MRHSELFDNRPRIRRNRLPSNPEHRNGPVGLGRFPSWLHRPLPKGNQLIKTGKVVEGQRLHTVCEEAKCPNLLECWTAKTATFLVLGKQCTRSCGFCDIDFSKTPPAPDPDEPRRVGASAAELGLRHIVVTMVARDDLPDAGSSHIAEVIKQIRRQNPGATIEVLTSDLSGSKDALENILDQQPEIFNHNIETVRRLTPRVRHRATYERTLTQLARAKAFSEKNFSGKLLVKSGIMVGLGEAQHEVEETIRDLHAAGVDIVTIGQYLQASRNKLRVQDFITPEQFSSYESYGHQTGIAHMYCGPFVRSSYNAGMVIEKAKINR